MQILIILFCALLSCLKVTIQGNLAKGNIKSVKDSVLANGLVFAVVSIFFLISLRNEVNVRILPYSFFFGLFGVIFQISYALALRSGPFSITCMSCNLSMVIPIVFSFIVFKEGLTLVKGIGILLCIATLFLNSKKDDKKISAIWLVFVALTFLSNGGIGSVQRVFAKSDFGSNVEQFVFFGYLFAFLITSVVFLFVRKNGEEINLKLTPKNTISIVIIGLFLGVFQYTYTYANSIIDAAVLIPSVNVLATIFQMMAGKVVFREKFSARQIVSICIGICSVLLMSL